MAYCWQAFPASFSCVIRCGGSGTTSTPSRSSSERSAGSIVSLLSLQLPLMAPMVPSGFRPHVSDTPTNPVRLTRGPNVGQRTTHITQPLPLSVQKLCPPAVPVASTNTSPSMARPLSSTTASIRSAEPSMALTRLCSQISTSWSRTASRTPWAMVFTSYSQACAWPGKARLRWSEWASQMANSSPPPSAIISSAAVYRPLLRMMPPTSPVPSSSSVRSISTTRSAPALRAAMAAAQPDQPPPTMITWLLIGPPRGVRWPARRRRAARRCWRPRPDPAPSWLPSRPTSRARATPAPRRRRRATRCRR